MKLFNKDKKQLNTTAKFLLEEINKNKGFTFAMGDNPFENKYMELKLNKVFLNTGFNGELLNLNKGYVASKNFDLLNLWDLEQGGTNLGLPISMKLLDKKLMKKMIIDFNNQKQHNLEFFGAWVNNEDIYFDLSTWFKTKKEALAFAKANKQLAIWDCAKAQEIRVK